MVPPGQADHFFPLESRHMVDFGNDFNVVKAIALLRRALDAKVLGNLP